MRATMDRRWLFAGVPALAAVVVLLGLTVPGLRLGASESSSTTSYDAEVLADETTLPLAEVRWPPAVNRHGHVAVASTDEDGDWYLHALDGESEPMELSGQLGALGPPDITDRGYVVATHETAAGGQPVRDVQIWSTVAEGPWLTLDRAGREPSTAGEGMPALGTYAATGETLTVRVLVEPAERAEEQVHRLVTEPVGPSPPVLTGDDLDALRPALSDGGLIAVSTGSELLLVQPPFEERTVLADADAGFERIGRTPAISSDGSVVAFTAVRDGRPGIYLINRDLGMNWSRPVEITGGQGEGPALEPLDIDDPVGLASVRRPPEDGDLVVVGLLARAASAGALASESEDGQARAVEFTTEPALWTLGAVLRGSEPDPSALTTRLVAQVGGEVAGRTLTDIRFGGGLAFPRDQVGGPADHWIAFAAETEGAPLIVRATVTGSSAPRAARTFEEAEPHHEDAPGGSPEQDHDAP